MAATSDCSHASVAPLFSPARSGWEDKLLRCVVCGLGFLSPAPAPEEIQRFYPDDYYSFHELCDVPRPFDLRAVCIRGAFGSPRLVDRIAHRLFRGRFGGDTRIERVGKILDVGCGDGYVLSALREIGWDVSGVELSRAAAKRGVERGLNIIAGDLVGAGFRPESFDVIRMSHVLEHCPCPAREIAEAYRLLRLGGRIIVAVPNLASWAARLFKRDWSALDLPRHLYHFMPSNLLPLLTAAGFRPLHVFSYSVGTAFSSLAWVRQARGSRGAGRTIVTLGLKGACVAFDCIANLAGRGDCFEIQAVK